MDTRSKRASALTALRSWVLAPPLPDGALSQGDRQHIAWTYAGIAATALAMAVVVVSDVRVRPRVVLTGLAARARVTATSATARPRVVLDDTDVRD